MDDPQQEPIDIDPIEQAIDDRIEEYRKFAFKDNMVKLAIAFVLGTSFGKVVTSISENLLMPFIKFFTSFAGNTWREAVWTPFEGMRLEVGKFVAASLDFLIASLILFTIWRIFVRFGWLQPDEPKSLRHPR